MLCFTTAMRRRSAACFSMRSAKAFIHVASAAFRCSGPLRNSRATRAGRASRGRSLRSICAKFAIPATGWSEQRSFARVAARSRVMSLTMVRRRRDSAIASTRLLSPSRRGAGACPTSWEEARRKARCGTAEEATDKETHMSDTSEHIDHRRRRLLGVAAMTIAAADFLTTSKARSG